MTGLKTKLALLVPMMVPLLYCGCDLFSTRDPEPPTSGSSTFTPPTSADLVIENLTNAIAEKNTENYMRCLVDTLNSGRSYAFIPTAEAAGRYSSTFSEWTLQSEKSYFSALIALTPASVATTLSLSGGFDLIAADSAIYNSDYQLTFPHGIVSIAETVRGNLQLVLATDRNSLWSIVRWTDNPISNEISWSEWKGRLAN